MAPSFWFDKWLGDFALADIASIPTNTLDKDLQVCELWNGNCWRWEELWHLIPQHALLLLASRAVHFSPNKTDTITWKPSPPGEFIVKSTYSLQNKETNLKADSALWKAI